MPLIDTHKFADDLKKRPGPGSNDPPRSIRASDLDENFVKVCVIADKRNTYSVNYTKDGTELNIFPSIPQAGIHVLGSVDGKIQWIKTQDCEASL